MYVACSQVLVLNVLPATRGKRVNVDFIRAFLFYRLVLFMSAVYETVYSWFVLIIIYFEYEIWICTCARYLVTTPYFIATSLQLDTELNSRQLLLYWALMKFHLKE